MNRNPSKEVHGSPVNWKRMQHGTASSYKHGCRGDECGCREAGRIANAKYRASFVSIRGSLVRA